MRVLAIDTALGACAAAVLDSEHGEMLAHESQAMQRGHAEALMPLVARVMAQAGIGFADLDRIAVTVGPGSFTGLRVGIAAARGIALAAGKPVIGVTTLAAYAAPFILADTTRPVAAAVDARHAHVYLKIVGPGGHLLVAPRLASLVEAAQRAATCGALRLCGNAATLMAEAWPADQAPPAAAEQLAAPDIDWVARLGAAAEDTGAPVKPLYLRPPDARPQAAAQLPRR